MKIEWTDPAVSDLAAIRDFIARDSEFYATRFVGRIIDAVEKLVDFPARGRRVPEASDDALRELLFYDYRIIYRVEPERIRILTVLHGSRDLSQKQFKPWDPS